MKQDKFETELCELLSQKGYWVHNFSQNLHDRPMDIIAVKDGHATMINCIICEKDEFLLSRIETNQEETYEQWNDTGSKRVYFALKFKDGSIYMLDAWYALLCRDVKKIEKIKREDLFDLYSYWLIETT